MSFTDYETQKKWAINVRQWGYTFGVWVLVATLISGGFALNEWRKVSVTNRKLIEQNVAPAVKEIVGNLQDSAKDFQTTAKNSAQASEEFRLLAGDIRSEYLPQITSDLHRTQTILRSTVQDLGEEVRTQIHNNGTALEKVINSTNGLITTSVASLTDQINGIAEEVRGTARRVRVLVDDPELAKALGEVYASAKALRGSTDNVEIVTASLASMSKDLNDSVHKLTHPQPQKGFVGKMKFALSYLKDIGGVVYLVVRILNGL